MSPADAFDERVAAIREFNRYYISRMGFLNRSWASVISLTEARVLHEIYIRPSTTATEIGRLIAMDAGHLSRMLRKFETQGYITRKKPAGDGRQRLLAIAPKGRRAYDEWSTMARENVARVIRDLDEDQQSQVVDAMRCIKELIGKTVPIDNIGEPADA